MWISMTWKMCDTFVLKWVKVFEDIIFLYWNMDWRGCGYQSICYPASSGLSVYPSIHSGIKKLILQWSSNPSHRCLCNFCCFILSPGFFCPGYLHVHCLALTSAAAVLLLKLPDCAPPVWCVKSNTFVFQRCSYALLTSVKVLLLKKTIHWQWIQLGVPKSKNRVTVCTSHCVCAHLIL